MSIEVAIVDLLRKRTSAFQVDGEERFFPGVAGQDAESPYLAYHLLDETEGYFLSRPDGVPRARLQLDIWSTDPDERAKLGSQVKNALNGFQGWAGPVFAKCIKARIAGDDEEEDADRYWYRRRVEVEADYEQQPAPTNRGKPLVRYRVAKYTAAVQNHSGAAQFVVDALHGLAVGDRVNLTGFANYSGHHFVTEIGSPPNFICGLSFVANDYGYWSVT